VSIVIQFGNPRTHAEWQPLAKLRQQGREQVDESALFRIPGKA